MTHYMRALTLYNQGHRYVVAIDDKAKWKGVSVGMSWATCPAASMAGNGRRAESHLDRARMDHLLHAPPLAFDIVFGSAAAGVDSRAIPANDSRIQPLHRHPEERT